MAKSPVAIIILDGFGWRPEVEGNAVAQAKKPNFDRYYNEFPHTTLKASGKDYFKIVFWNRFIRNPIELILSWLPAVISLVLLCLHYYSSFLLNIYFWIPVQVKC